jgi:hypothetical protein
MWPAPTIASFLEFLRASHFAETVARRIRQRPSTEIPVSDPCLARSGRGRARHRLVVTVTPAREPLVKDEWIALPHQVVTTMFAARSSRLAAFFF